MIRIVKLITGEEILTEIGQVTNGMVPLKNPVRIAVTNQGVGLAPFIMFSKKDKTVEISPDCIMCWADPEDELKNGYNKEFGSGIITANANAVNMLDNMKGLSQ